ncbi:unnamed protein product [Hermetia illucens]|uniref:SET domain-containing protein n=1 Tax=Hermetia illucens TaxID=343691 RepID=A0A7R8V3D3_HERIL|nr:SET domain-containing protein SmydA-8 [Hermetia illucens]CAD7091694.1 unnamed protein product [Hermetia illucens]
METISALIDFHLNEKSSPTRIWRVSATSISGRGLFAVRDIQPGEIIFREKPLLIGPTAGKDSSLNICSVCYRPCENNECVCPRGCSLPVCELCLDSKQHLLECNLYKSWQPAHPQKVMRANLRALVWIRGLLLNETQKHLVNVLQANVDPAYQREMLAAASNFHNFPSAASATYEFLFKVVCVLNTNAFEALQQNENAEISLRGLYPLSGIMNHECTPNTCHYFEPGNVMVVKSAKFIPQGTEITTTYTKILWSNLSRRVFLNMTKQFVCSCSRCLDPTENGSYISALLCRKNDCLGWIIPQDGNVLLSDWRCIKCGTIYDSKHISRAQDFTLRIFNGKTSSGSVKDILDFIREKAARICPPTSQFIIELKLHAIWKMTKTNEKFSDLDIKDAIQYCKDILFVLDKLHAGECILKSLLEDEIRKFSGLLLTPK